MSDKWEAEDISSVTDGLSKIYSRPGEKPFVCGAAIEIIKQLQNELADSQLENHNLKADLYGLEQLQKENAELRADNVKLVKGINAVRDVINNSHGVIGLHLNGDIAEWAQLESGGHFQEWLEDFNDAEKLTPEGGA